MKIEEAVEYVKKYGINEIVTFDKRKRVMENIG